MTVNPLICVPSPRDIADFQNALEKLSFDRFIVKYHREVVAYPRIREFFLSHTEYDTLIWFADDLVVTAGGLERLLMQQSKHPQDVISGICNFDQLNNRHKYCFRLIGDSGYYPIIDKIDEYFRQYHGKEKYPNSGLYLVEFNAFACVVVSREIVQKIPFRFSDYGTGVDQNFCDDCRKEGIDLLVDINVRFEHLALRLGKPENFYVGLMQPREDWWTRRVD